MGASRIIWGPCFCDSPDVGHCLPCSITLFVRIINIFVLIPFPCTLFVSKLWCCNVLCKGETVSLVSTSHYGDPVWHLPKCHNIWFRSKFSADTLAPSPSASLQVTKGKTAKRVRRSSRRFWIWNAFISQKAPPQGTRSAFKNAFAARRSTGFCVVPAEKRAFEDRRTAAANGARGLRSTKRRRTQAQDRA